MSSALLLLLLLPELGLWPSSGADFSSDISRRRVHRRLLANQRGGAHVRRLHGIGQLFPTTGCTHFWVECSDKQTRARRHGSYFRFPAPRNEVLDRQCPGEGQPVRFISFIFRHSIDCCCRQIIGVLATLERFLADADERGKAFLINFLDKQHTRLKGLFERHVVRHAAYIYERRCQQRFVDVGGADQGGRRNKTD